MIISSAPALLITLSILHFDSAFCLVSASQPLINKIGDHSPIPKSYPAVHTEWTVLNYSWNAEHTYDDYYSNGRFIPENCVIAGINVAKNGVIYVSVPRWKSGVPATLNTIENNGNSDIDSEGVDIGEHLNALVPYPSWEIQEVGVMGALQNTQSMTIDSHNRMWALEVGRRNFLDSASSTVDGAAGVWLFDLDTGAVLTKYYFSDDVVAFNNSFLDDIALDEKHQMAYFSDAWGEGAIIVLDYSSWTARRFSGPSTMNDPDYVMIVNGINYGRHILTTPVDGIALTADGEALFYCAVQNTALYRLPTAVLRDFAKSNEEISSAVEYIGYKLPSDGIKWSNGVLYYGDLTSNTYDSVYINATSKPSLNTSSSAAIATTDDESDVFVEEPSSELMNWIDTFAVDLSLPGRMWFTSNRLNLFLTGKTDYTGAAGANMRIMFFDTDQNPML